uniref:Uncharacterized protein n=1 Tax=Candidatus Kentrum sp. DK TaxID=2126562 RepID=A0A450S6H4_9GAMM|nr:MAG: hypothetical protein BECKDK2373B_GA0170837_10177 [Candidatus Kentron sp. DK]
MDNIDAVAMMRRIRDDLDRKMQGMTWEEKREFIRNSIKSFDFITKREDDTSPGNPGREIRQPPPSYRRENTSPWVQRRSSGDVSTP